MAVWARKAPERTSPAKAEAAWARVLARRNLTEDQLLAAVRACVRRDPDFGRGKAMNFDRWLDEDRFDAWLIAGAGDQAADGLGRTEPDRFPDEAVRASFVEALSEHSAKSYLDPSGWEPEGRRLIARTHYAFDWLTRHAQAVVAGLDLTLVPPPARSNP